MNAWTVTEIDNVVGTLRSLVGSRLQEVQTGERDVVLGFYTQGQLHWLWIDLDAVRPCLVPWSALPMRVNARKSPLNLFLRAHFGDRVLRDVYRDEHEGRVVHLAFGRADDGEAPHLEVRLFPHGRNVLARAGKKSIAWQKPRPLSEEAAAPPEVRPPRDLERLRDEWVAIRGGSGSRGKNQGDPRRKLGDAVQKKRRALAKVDEELARKREFPWGNIGEWLKREQTLRVPREWEALIDSRRNLAWNIEESFRRARELAQKLIGTEKRRAILIAELEALERQAASPNLPRAVASEKPALQPLKGAGAEGRTLRLENDLVAVQGKNAADNLKLLRRARAWDLWLHLRDTASSHAILFRNKNVLVSDHVLLQVAAWFVRNHLGPKHAQHAGERFEFMVAECRFVRPIKGDRAGRVNYTNERTITYRLTASDK